MRVQRLAASAVEPRRYLEGANLGFGQWGDEATFAWVFRHDAELLFVEDETGNTIAASGITWRTLHSGQRAAIMTGAWTREEARGRGAFGLMVEEIRSAARERDGTFLGFVRTENASRRHLGRLGAQMQPTFYCRSTRALVDPVPLDSIEPDPATFPAGFLYTAEEWRTQFLERPHARIECIGRRGEWGAVVERTAEFDRVHAIDRIEALPLLAARSHTAGRRLFWFTTRPPAGECEWTDGFLASLPPLLTDWALQNGDRM